MKELKDNTLRLIRNAVRDTTLLKGSVVLIPREMNFDNIRREKAEKDRLKKIADDAFGE
jgi:hypothetical protein